MSPCLSPRLLAKVASGISPVDPSALQHIENCEVCSRRVDFLRRCLAEDIDELASEADQTTALLAELEARPRARWHRQIVSRRFRRPSLVRRLLVLALAARAHDTRIALAYSNAATIIVDLLINDGPPLADLRFDAWRYHSTLLREMGQFQRFLKAFATACDAAKATSDPELSEATTLLAHALYFIEPDVWHPDEGRVLLERAERIFRRRDPRKLQHVKTAYGMLAYRAADYEKAAAIFEEVLASTSRDDVSAYTDALGNYLSAFIRCGHSTDVASRRIDVLEALDLHHGWQINVLRDRWQRGFLLFARGKAGEAARLLRDTALEFKTLGHTDTAIRVGADAIRALVRDQQYDAANELAGILTSEATAWEQRERLRIVTGSDGLTK